MAEIETNLMFAQRNHGMNIKIIEGLLSIFPENHKGQITKYIDLDKHQMVTVKCDGEGWIDITDELTRERIALWKSLISK